MYRLSLAAFVLLISSFASATATVSGKLVNPDTSGGIPGYAQFDLENCGGNFPIVTGASIAPRQTFTLANDGTWSGVMYRNDEITCNGSASTWWRMTYFVNSRQTGPARDFICSQASCAFDSMTPLTVYPALPSPIPPSGSVLTAPVGPQTITGGFGLTNSGPVTGTTLTATTSVVAPAETITSSPTGLAAVFPLQSLGNGATPAGIIAGGVNWPSMGFFADIIPSGSTQIETDSVQGIVENQSTTTGGVGLRGQAQAGANSTNNWGGNLLCTDYDHAGTAYTATKCTGLEIDTNTKSATTIGAALQLIEAGPVAPTTFPAISILGQGGGQFSQGVTVNNGAVSTGGPGFAAGSQGATGVANKPSNFFSMAGSNSGAVGKGINFESSQDGDFIILTTAGRGVGVNLGGTTSAPTEPVEAFDVNGRVRTSAILLNATSTATSPGLWMQANLPTLTGGTAGIQFNNAANNTATFTVDNAGAAAATVSMAAPKFLTATNCASSAAPAVCGSAAAGSVVIAAAATTVTVNDTAVTANSEILVSRDDSLGTRLSVTCNTQSSLVLGSPRVTGRTAGVSFVVTIDAGPTTNPMCLNYSIVN